MGAVCIMKECLHSVVCRVPLTEGAEVGRNEAFVFAKENLFNLLLLK